MYCASLQLTGPKPVVQCVPAGLLILPQKVKMKAGYADALGICGRPKSGQGPSDFAEDFLCLMFGCFCEPRKRLGLKLRSSCADFLKYAIHSHGAEKVCIRRFLNHRQEVDLRLLLRHAARLPAGKFSSPVRRARHFQ
jgi:hypothetical protein